MLQAAIQGNRCSFWFAFPSSSSFFWLIASLLHQQRSRPFLWVSTCEVKHSRRETKQSKHKPKPQQTTTTKTKAPTNYLSPALSTRGRRRSPWVIEQRRACGKGRKMRRFARSTRFPKGRARPARAPWWSATGDLLARTTEARPAQGTPWWSASGATPSNSRDNLRFDQAPNSASSNPTVSSRNWGCSQQGSPVPSGRRPASDSSCGFRRERLQTSSQQRKASERPMVVSQWGLDSRRRECKTSPGHPMVVSHWSTPSNSQHKCGSLTEAGRKVPNLSSVQSVQPGRIAKISWGRSHQSPPGFPGRITRNNSAQFRGGRLPGSSPTITPARSTSLPLTLPIRVPRPRPCRGRVSALT